MERTDLFQQPSFLYNIWDGSHLHALSLVDVFESIELASLKKKQMRLGTAHIDVSRVTNARQTRGKRVANGSLNNFDLLSCGCTSYDWSSKQQEHIYMYMYTLLWRLQDRLITGHLLQTHFLS